jgi:hypothetical protein
MALIGTLSYALALVQNRALWGFWFNRPTLTEALQDATELLGVSGLRFDDMGLPVSSSATRSRLIELVPEVCNPANVDKGYYCLEHRLLLALMERFGELEQVSDVDPMVLSITWQRYRTEGWRPSTAPGYRGSPHIGLALHFRKGSQDYVILAYESSEIAGDRYAYGEALYRLTRPFPMLVREHRLFYEVAGAEAWGTPILTVINAILLTSGSLLVMLVRRQQGPIAKAVVFGVGAMFLLAGLSLLGHTRWTWGFEVFVPLIWAFLLVVPALFAIWTAIMMRVRAGSQRTP